MDINILTPVLFQNGLLTLEDMEYLQLSTITESKKVHYLYLELLRLGEERYEEFMNCLKDPYAIQHGGHTELYEKLSTSQQ